MNRIILAFLIQSLLWILPLSGSGKEIGAPIVRVTVYPDRAQITHEGSADIAAGQNILRLSGLSPYIDAQSIRVSGYGNFTILSVNHQNNYLQNLEELPEIRSIRSQIETLQIKVEDEKSEISVLKEKEAFLIANRAILASKQGAVTPDQLKAMMDLYTGSMDQVATTILKKNRLIKDFENQITALQNQINDRKGKKQLPSGEITVSVSSTKPGTGKFTISYVVSNAGWHPSYDIRVEDISKPVSIFYKANVFQNTGVDWKDVKLSFSNANPWIAGTMPLLPPWFIDFYVPPQARYLSGRAASVNTARKSEAPAMVEMAADAETFKAVEASPVAVEKQVGETTVSFDIAVPYSIASDGKIQTIEIQRTASPAEYKYVSIPKLSPHAYLTGNITNWAEQNLQSGEVTLYFENTFVGKSFLNVNQLSDTLTLSLGTDNSILVKREKRKDFTSKRVIGANKTDIFSFLITVRNNKATGIKITLNDQIPVSTNSSITVEAQELSGGRLNTQTGEVKWDLEVKPRETRELILSYSVKYPKDRTIILE
ncbi:MAG: mucoidy inhibitor MuiA family protein [Bacteroidales bacterium]|nr:mucoidy inhibitor MuiA family protein [Bacteroidales bacterium]MBN2634449.1 mucoidy inhibitor MuiA family protein [Bacteroidales bacterium]